MRMGWGETPIQNGEASLSYMATWGVGGDGGGGGATIAGKCKTARRDRRSYFFIARRAVAHTAATLSTGVYWK